MLSSPTLTRFFRALLALAGGTVLLAGLWHGGWVALLAPLFTAIGYSACSRLRNVAADDLGLYVSSFEGEVLVPYSELSRIELVNRRNNPAIWIVTRSRFSFGSNVIFLPPSGQARAIATDLRRRVEA